MLPAPRFSTGQVVEFTPTPGASPWSPPGLFCVLWALPPSDGGEWRYCVSSLHDGHQQAVRETELRATDAEIVSS